MQVSYLKHVYNDSTTCFCFFIFNPVEIVDTAWLPQGAILATCFVFTRGNRVGVLLIPLKTNSFQSLLQ